MRASRLVVSMVAVTILSGAAYAAGEPSGRYTMSPAADGVVRLDTQTGAMALCRHKDDKWACEDMEDSQRDLLAEIDKLRAENKTLKDQVEHLGGTLGPDENQADAAPAPGAKLVLPSEEDVDKAFDYFERMLNKLHDRMEKLEKEHTRKPETAL